MRGRTPALSARRVEAPGRRLQGRATLPPAPRIAESRVRQSARDYANAGYGSSLAFAEEAPSSSSASFIGTA
jgi:hypothetical protein